MKKLSLDLDKLAVDTFQPAVGARVLGVPRTHISICCYSCGAAVCPPPPEAA